MRNEQITLQQSVELMHTLEFQDQTFHQLTEPGGYTWLLDRLRAIGSPDTKSVVFLFGADATTLQQLKRIRRNKGTNLGDMTVYAVEVPHA
ncbi:hypothetical protein N878_07580 [Pseudomonas sp. EGD-AK9]|uniref:hypothetical protein n=1 Tax=Pseudomonas sp. EGD-AK9 TaxID=1386078 RepID=UPI00039762BC|nr:hypothetical protein [Pseudomonas sp. EGD-AK9]ERI50885.1 hypothetical protein N878_07580 [Pseudomonas sp. EGD-AK9]